VVAWARFAKRTRKEVIRVLTKTITIYPDMDGTDQRQGSSVAEQLIRKQRQTPSGNTQPHVKPETQTQQP
jgi:hypothetical protein